MIAWLALAALADEPGGVDVRAWLEDRSASGGVWVVQTRAPTDAELAWRLPPVAGAQVAARDDVRVEAVGELEVRTYRYVFTAPRGRYELPAVEVKWTDAGASGTASSPALFVDLGVPPPRDGELVDIVEPPPIGTFPWGVALGGTAVVGLFVGGLLFAFRRPRPEALAPARELSPDARALAAWEAARSDASLDDHGRGVALSRIVRDYLEAVLAFPATARTTRETLAHLGTLRHLDNADVGRADRLLRATDLVKYADVDAGPALFDRLDDDLRGLLASTRPHRWEGES